MKKITLVLILLLANIVYTQEYRIVGHLNDYQNKAIEGGLIQIKELDKKVTTDKFGHYEILVPEGSYDVIYYFLGMVTEKHNITVSKKDYHLDIKMTEEPLGLDQVVISSSSVKNYAKKETVNNISVLNSTSIEQTSSPSLFDGLKFQPGIRTFRTCQNCGSSELSINGLPGVYSQILINGKPIFGGVSSIYGLEQIPSSIIDRVEIIKGGGSIYSSYAIGGSLNIITKTPIKEQSNTSNNLGFIGGRTLDNVSSFNASIIGDNNKNGIFIFGNLRLRDPHDFDNDGYSELTKIRTTTIGLKRFFYFLDTKITTEVLNIRESRRGGGMDMNQADIFSLLSENVKSNLYVGGLTLDGNFSDDFKYSLYFNFQDNYLNTFYGGRDDESSEPDIKGYGNLISKVYIVGNEYTFNTEEFITGKTEIIFGVNFKYDFLRDTKDGYNIHIDQSVKNINLFIQDNWIINDYFSMILGLRGDTYDINYNDIKRNGFFITPRLNLKYNINDEYAIKVGYSLGARAPQIYGESIHSKISGGLLNQVAIADDLKIEYSNSFTSSFVYSPIVDDFNLEFSIDVFFNILQNPFISEETISQDQSVRFMVIKNSSSAKVFGSSFEGKISYKDKFTFQINATLQESKYKERMNWSDDLEGTFHFINNPNIYGGFIFSYMFLENFTINLSGNYTGRQYIPHYAGYISMDRLEYVEDFFDFNFKLGYDFSFFKNTNTNINIYVNNLFNNYQKDLDKTNFRDSGYIYGTSTPRVLGIGIKISYE